MKVTVCFDDLKLIVPCNSCYSLTNGSQLNENPKVSDVIEGSILRFKKATQKVNSKLKKYFFFIIEIYFI